MATSLNQLWSVVSSGLHSQQRHLELLSHNIANVNTPGFKASRGEFQSLFRERILDEADAAIYLDAQPGDVVFEGLGTVFAGTTRLFSQGDVEQTGQPFHLAIQGDGFFQVRGVDGQLYYTRAGDFTQDGAGNLVNGQGQFLEPHIQIPAEVRETFVDRVGRIWGYTAEGETLELGTIQLARFPNPEGLLSVGDNNFLPTAASGEAELGPPGEDGRGVLLSGFLEQSNVDLGQAMVTLLRTHRAYSLNLRALRITDELYRLSNDMPQP